jgi:cytochrome P450
MQPRQTLAVDEIDLSDPEFWTLPLEEREGAYKTLREERPIAFFEDPEIPPEWGPRGPGHYVATRHRDVVEASRQPEIYSSARGATSPIDMPPPFLEFFGSMINLDDPRHARLRNIVSRAFTPRVLRQLESDVQRVASGIVEGIAAKGSCDFVTDVAARLPLDIICDMMGVPPSERDMVFRCSNVILSQGDPEYIPEGADVAAELLQAGQSLSEMVQELARHRADHPGDDLTTALVQADIDGERLSYQELGSFFILLVVAGNETTRNAISHALVALTEYPAQRQILLEDFESRVPTAVEEIVRWASPVIWMRRSLTRDAELGGHPLEEGDKILLLYASANRDEEAFEDPYTFDLLRDPNPHVGFGGPGPHFCLGAHLARREITVMYRELLSRLPDIEAAGEPERLQSSFINGIKHLPCSFTPRR